MNAKAVGRYLRHSPQKGKLVLDQIRGKGVEEAFLFLRFCPKAVARDIEKILKSAVANAQHKDKDLDTEELVVSKADVGPAPSLKRWRARARGRVARILKRSSHITLEVGKAESGTETMEE
jgi:large subunit ribosomal protein L22